MKVTGRRSHVTGVSGLSMFRKLQGILRELKRVVIAYSGGLDSTFLLKVALDTLGRTNVVAVTARSETYPESEYKCAQEMASRMGAQHVTVHTKELEIRRFTRNPVNRCYYCKRELFKKLTDIARTRNLAHVIDGTNYDDLKDVRYGMKAARELGVRSPLLEARIGKDLIRRLSRSLGLPTWSKPSCACLASRFPFNEEINEAMLLKIERAERYVRTIGIRQVRVRVHKDIARIETYVDDIPKVVRSRKRIAAFLKKLGFVYVTVDLEGYRTGSMHEPMRPVPWRLTGVARGTLGNGIRRTAHTIGS